MNEFLIFFFFSLDTREIIVENGHLWTMTLKNMYMCLKLLIEISFHSDSFSQPTKRVNYFWKYLSSTYVNESESKKLHRQRAFKITTHSLLINDDDWWLKFNKPKVQLDF